MVEVNPKSLLDGLIPRTGCEINIDGVTHRVLTRICTPEIAQQFGLSSAGELIAIVVDSNEQVLNIRTVPDSIRKTTILSDGMIDWNLRDAEAGKLFQ